MTKLDPIARRVVNNLTPTQVLEVSFPLTGVLRMANGYAFAAITRREPAKVKLSEMSLDMARHKTPRG